MGANMDVNTWLKLNRTVLYETKAVIHTVICVWVEGQPTPPKAQSVMK